MCRQGVGADEQRGILAAGGRSAHAAHRPLPTPCPQTLCPLACLPTAPMREQVSHIQTEKLLIKLVGQELMRRKAAGTYR